MTATLASAALFLGLWIALPLVIAPLVLLAALLPSGGRRPARARTERPVTVHDLPTSHPNDRAVRVVCH